MRVFIARSYRIFRDPEESELTKEKTEKKGKKNRKPKKRMLELPVKQWRERKGKSKGKKNCKRNKEKEENKEKRKNLNWFTDWELEFIFIWEQFPRTNRYPCSINTNTFSFGLHKSNRTSAESSISKLVPMWFLLLEFSAETSANFLFLLF